MISPSYVTIIIMLSEMASRGIRFYAGHREGGIAGIYQGETPKDLGVPYLR